MSARAAIDAAPAGPWPDEQPFALHLILRHDGRPLATAQAVATPGPPHVAARATVDLLRKASRDPAIRELPPDVAAEGLRHTTLELDWALPPVPITAADLTLAASTLDPAADGLALRQGDRWFLRFPSEMRMTGAAATQDTLHELALLAGLTPEEIDHGRRAGTIGLYRFETLTLAQPPGESIPRLFDRARSDRVWTGSAQQLDSLLDRAGSNLVGRAWQEPEDGAWHIADTYRPPSDGYDALEAAPRDTALAALALARFAFAPGVDARLAETARARSADLIASTPRTDPVVLALVAHAGDALSPSEKGTLRSILQGESAPLIDRVLAATVLEQDPQSKDAILSLMNTLESCSTTELEDLLPWIVWLSDEHQRRLEPKLMETVSRLETRLQPDDRRPCCAAVMLRQAAALPRIVPITHPANAQALSLLNRLCVDESAARWFRVPKKAFGGVQLAPWDERMPIWAQAMGILLMCDTLMQITDDEVTP